MVGVLTGGRSIDRTASSNDRLGRLANVFQTEYEGLLRFAFLVSGDRSTAEDLVQEAFVRIYQADDRIDVSSLRAYARRTIVNLHQSTLRRLAVRRSKPPWLFQPQDPGNRSPHDEVREALTALRPGERACLALRFYEDMAERDIADTLGISISAVKKRIQRGLQKVRSILGEDDSQ